MAVAENPKRELWIDWIKGILALCVILSHTEGSPVLYHVLDSFMLIPGFFIMSGYVCHINPKRIRLYYGQRVLKIFILYAVWTFIPPFLKVSNWKSFFADPMNILRVLFNSFKSVIKGSSLWFVACLICVMILFGFIVWITRNNYLIMAIISFCIFLVGFIFARDGEMFYWSADTALVGQFFFIMGYLLNQLKVFEREWFIRYEDKWRMGFTFAFAAVLILGTIFCGKISINMATNSYHFLVVTFLGFITGNGFLILLARKIGTNRFLTYVGSHSLIYFAIGSMETGRFLRLFSWLADKTGSSLLSNPYFVNPAVVLLCAVLTLIPCCIIDKWIPFLNGKFKLFPNWS